MNENTRLLGYQSRELMKNLRHAFETVQYEDFPDHTAVSYGWVVGYLDRHKDQDIYQKDLEKAFHMAPSSITAMVKSLEKSGLIRRESVEKDARLKRIVMTEAGEKFHKKTIEHFDILEKMALRDIPQEDVDKFFDVIIQINKNVKQYEKEVKGAHDI